MHNYLKLMAEDYREIRDNLKLRIRGKKPVPDINEAVENVLWQFNCKVHREKDGKQNVFYFVYQNSPFRLYTFDGRSDLNIDMTMTTVEADDFEVMRSQANLTNANTLPVSMYYRYDAEKNNYIVYLTAFMTGASQSPTLKADMALLFDVIFLCKHNFETELAKSHATETLSEGERNRLMRDLALLHETEMEFQTSAPYWRNNPGQLTTVKEMTDRLYPGEGLQINGLSVYCGTEMTEHKGVEAEQVELLRSVIRYNGESTEPVCLPTATLLIDCFSQATQQPKTICVMLTTEVTAPPTIFVRLTALSPVDPATSENWLNAIHHSPKAYSFLLGYDLSSAANMAAEVRFMWSEALDKLAKGDTDLSIDEALVVGITDNPDIRKCVYRGYKHYSEKRFFEALPFLENAAEKTELDFFDNWNDDKRQFFARICYYIGYCHCALGNPLLSIPYLDKAVLVWPCTLHLTERIHAMVDAKDFRVMGEVAGHLDMLNQELSSADDDGGFDESKLELYEFLHKAYVAALLRFNRLDDARQRLNSLLHNELDSLQDFAKEQLAAIGNG